MRGPAARRRLFAGDAGQGVALLELLRSRYDVVLMNPPFGAGSWPAKKEFEKTYPRTKNDLYAAFVERGMELLNPQRLLGAITSRAGFFLSTFRSGAKRFSSRRHRPWSLRTLAMVSSTARWSRSRPTA